MFASLTRRLPIAVLFLSTALLYHPGNVLGAEERQIDLDVNRDGTIVAGGRHRLEADMFPQRLQSAMQKLQKAGIDPKDVTILLRYQDDTVVGQMKLVVQRCQEQGIEHFELPCERPYQLHLPLGAAAVFAPEAADELPSLKLRLEAKEDGSLKRMTLNKQVLASTQQLQRELIKILGDDRGPDSIFQKIELVFDADDDLQMKYVSQAYSAVSGYPDSGGKLNPLIQKVLVFGTGSIEEIEIEEEFSPEEVEFESLEQHFEPLSPVEAPKVAPPAVAPK